MKMLTVIYYEILKNIRDFRIMIGVLLYPIVMILVLGTALNGRLSVDLKDKIRTGYVNLDQGAVGDGLEKVFESDEVKSKIAVFAYDSESVIQDALSKGEIDNFFIVPADTTNGLMKGKSLEIRVKGNNYIEYVKALLESFSSSFNAQMTAVRITGQTVDTTEGDYFQRIIPRNSLLPRSIDYYSVLTLLQVLMLGSILGCFIVLGDKWSQVSIRMASLPLAKWQVVWGKVIGNSLFLFLSCIVTILFTKFVYQVEWNGNLLIIGFSLLVFCLISIGIGVIAGTLVKSLLSAIGIAFMMMLIFSNASGAISPSAAMPQLNFLNPNYHAKVLVFGTLYHYSDKLMLHSALSLMIILAVVLAFVGLGLRRIRYDNI